MPSLSDRIASLVSRLDGRAEQRLRELVADREAVVRQREATVRDREKKVFELEEDIRRLSAARWEPIRSTPPAPGDSAASLGDPQAQLRAWTAVAQRFSKQVHLGGQQLIEPYLLERPLSGTPTRFIIGTDEGRRWYDKPQLHEVHIARLRGIGLLNRGDTVFDCGANQGIYSLLYASAVGPKGKVIGFDPFPLNIAIARFNAALNKKDNIEFIERGLSDHDHIAEVSEMEQCVKIDNTSAPDRMSIKLERLDNYAALRPDFIKFDIEGAEVDALAGAQEILETRPGLLVDVHAGFLPRFGHKPADVLKYIRPEHYVGFFATKETGKRLVDLDWDRPLDQSGALYFIPRSRPYIRRYYRLGAVENAAG